MLYKIDFLSKRKEKCICREFLFIIKAKTNGANLKKECFRKKEILIFDFFNKNDHMMYIAFLFHFISFLFLKFLALQITKIYEHVCLHRFFSPLFFSHFIFTKTE